MNELATISKLRQAQLVIHEVKKLDDIKKLIDQSEALKGYARAQSLSKEMRDDITEYNLYATRQLGVISKSLADGRGKNQYTKEETAECAETKTETLKNAGVEPRRATEAQDLADMSDSEFEDMVEQQRKSDNFTKTAVMKKAKKKKREKQRADLEEKGKTIIINYDLRHGDFIDVFADVPDGSVDCIITDPPYPHEFIDCWSKLSQFASRVLKPHGFCIAYSGQMYLPEVMRRLGENLDYYWCMSLYLPGGTQIVNGVNMMCRWKPILIYQNGKMTNRDAVIEDFFSNDKPNKDGHDWQQGENGIAYLVEKFTKPGELIIDPFCGAGTTLKVATALNRHCMSAEIDEQTYNIAKARLGSDKKRDYGSS